MTLTDTLDAALRARFAGRPVILAARIPEQLEGPLATARRAGGGPFLGLSLRDGPPVDGVEVVALKPGPRQPDFILEAARLEAALSDLPPAAARALEAFDPEGRAVVVAAHHLRVEQVAGRRRVGGNPSGRDLEDKTTVDAFWDAVGVHRLPSRVTPMAPGPLLAAIREVDAGDGVVVQGDNASGLEGGAVATRWVHDATTARLAGTVLSGRCRRVRVSPFVEGVPLSIHGWCLEQGVSVLRPVEMVVLRKRATGTFHFCGAATTWDPPDGDRTALRTLARRVALHLRARHGYRGAFSIDGVLTTDGFVPTELNARFPAGLNRVADVVPDLPLNGIDMVVRDGGLTELDPSAFEERLLTAADARRFAWCFTTTPTPPSQDHAIGLVQTDDGLRRATPGQPAQVTLRWSAAGPLGRLGMDEATPTPGPLAAARFTEAIAAAGPPLATLLAGRTAARPAR